MWQWQRTLKVINVQRDGWGEVYDVSRYVDASPDWGRPPLRNIKHILEWTPRKCTSVVIQSPYLDEDTLWDYLHDYGRAFHDTGKHCARLHFFGGKPLSQRRLVDGLRRYDARRVGHDPTVNPYLGYIVVRPTGKDCIGRTIIRPPFDDADRLADIHVRAVYRTTLCGNQLEVVGTPFMEQDESSHVCAGVALWILCYDLHRRYGTPRFYPRQVTEIATENLSRGPVDAGLMPEEMARMLRRVQCAVDLQWWDLEDCDDASGRQQVLRDFVDTVYGYVHSNVPVLLGYWTPGDRIGHAVLAVGHDLDREKPQAPASALGDWEHDEPPLASDFVSCFYVQDDQRGPYQALYIWRKGPDPRATGAGAGDLPILEDAVSFFLLPGLTEAARLFYGRARQLIRDHLEGVRFVPGMQREVGQLLRGVRLRLTFQKSRRFRAQLWEEQHGRAGLCEKHREAYQEMKLPRHIYVCDLCVETREQDKRFRARGEILLDATSPPYERAASVLAMRLADRLYIAGRDSPVVADRYEEDPWAPTNLDDYR